MFTLLIGIFFVLLDRIKQVNSINRPIPYIKDQSNIIHPHPEHVA